MKEKELRKICTCNICHNQIGNSKIPLFWRVKLERHGINAAAITMQQGLGMMVGARLAMVMGPDEEMTEIISSKEITVCENCAGKFTSVYEMAMED